MALGALVIFLTVRSRLRPTPDGWMLRSTNNPDRFFMWTTNGASYAHTFTYDPHAADDWLREAGGPFEDRTNLTP